MNFNIKGSIVALVTPMHEDGSFDLPAFDKLVEWHIDSGTNAIVVVGTTGESATLSLEEHCELVAHCVKVANGRIPVIAGTGSNNTDEALFFTRKAKEQGADAALLVTPYYNKPSQEGLYQHFRHIAERVEIPQILYNVPGRTACDLSFDTVKRLADIDNVVAIKDATGNVERGVELVQHFGDDFLVYSGEDSISLQLMLAGGAGTISVTANVAPAMMAKMCALALSGDEAGARALDDKLQALHKNLFLEGNPVPVKWALHRMGLVGPGIRLPLVELNAGFHVQVTDAMKQAGVELAAAA